MRLFRSAVEIDGVRYKRLAGWEPFVLDLRAMNAPIPAGLNTIPIAPKPPGYVHLKVHSSYSLLEGALPIVKLAKLAEAHGFPALGLTDTDNLFGALEFSEKLAGAGVQPIVGVSLAIDFADAPSTGSALAVPAPASKPAGRDGLLTLLAMSAEGYANLLKLVTSAHLDVALSDAPHIAIEALQRHTAGLICLTGGPAGPIDAMLPMTRARARERLTRLGHLFGDRLYVEIQRHGLPREAEVEPELLALAYALKLPLVATNEVYFATPDDHEAHDALLCIAEGSLVSEDKRRRVSPEHYFKSAEEMAALFADLPEALANTIEIARRCAFRPTGRSADPAALRKGKCRCLRR